VALRTSLVLLSAVVLSMTSCGGENELRTAGQTRDFIHDLAEGKNVEQWGRPTEDAVVAATTAYAHQGTIERLGTKLRENGREWSCKAAEDVHLAHKVVDGLNLELEPAEQINIEDTAESAGAAQTEVDSLIDDALHLTDSELVETISDTCELAEQLG
jgi:hypothetical protein